MADDQKNVIHVEILGQQYSIRSALESSYVSDVASYVQEMMRTVAERSPAADSVRVAVLAALNIADEYCRCRDGLVSDENAVKQRTLEIEAIVDQAINPVPTPTESD